MAPTTSVSGSKRANDGSQNGSPSKKQAGTNLSNLLQKARKAKSDGDRDLAEKYAIEVINDQLWTPKESKQ